MNSTRGFRILALIAVASACALTASAQSTTTVPPPSGTTTPPTSTSASGTHTPTPQSQLTEQQDKQDQANRIAEGIKSGQLTPEEAQKLEQDENKINNERAAMRAQDNGHLTAADKAQLKTQYKNTSTQIYDDKHNANTDPHNPNSDFGAEKQNQQDRIAQGVKSGSLTPSEAAKQEQQERNFNQTVRAQRKANGGSLTPAEKQADQQRLNQDSRNLYQAKHNNKGKNK
jgi:hypothetical protein